MQLKTTTAACALLLLVAAFSVPADAENWPGFRGPKCSGVSAEKNPPTKWSDSENLKWKTALPGPGSSSPVVWGDKVFVTCYSGYGIEKRSPGEMKNLKRHLICLDRASGKVLWNKIVAAVPEDSYRGFICEHGYASQTPVTDGKSVFVFFGKTGVIAFDFDGKQLWKKSMGTMSGSKRWGAASSPILYKDTVIVNASDEGRKIVALDKATGKEKWNAPADSLDLTYNTPLVVTVSPTRKDLVIAVPEELWGMNPDTGKLRWYAEMKPNGNISPSVVYDGSVVYATGGYRVKGTVAIQAGGKGNVTTSRKKWASPDSSYVPSPIVRGGHLYWVNESGQMFCLSTKTGKRIYREKLSRADGSSIPSRSVYASIVEIAGKFYAVTRKHGTVIIAAEPKFRQITVNQFKSDTSDFNASPAVSNGQLFLRSNKFIYCVQASKTPGLASAKPNTNTTLGQIGPKTGR
ncbi:MAG: PQQ-binding-like beta-propeller repeat protein [Phycisphaerales bacterium]|nr:PQQ-binding-like beta-propeller repeat protein [Phycisphaerales bacterium]